MLKAFRCDKTLQPVTFQACIDCAESGRAREVLDCHHSSDVLRGIVATQREKMDALSVTELLECQRALWLKKKKDFTIQPSKAYWAFRGQITHGMIELGKIEGDISEQRMYAEIGGYKVSGQPDLIRGKTIMDWKTTKVVPKQPYPHHILQVSCYRLIAAKNNIEINDALICYIDMGEHKVLPMKLMGIQETEAFMLKELKARYEMLAQDEPPSFETYFSPNHWKCGRSEQYSYCEVRGLCTAGQTINQESKPRKVKSNG